MNYLEYLQREIKGGLKDKKRIKNIISSFVEIDNSENYTEGVYQIENFYIGRSKNIESRIVYHILELIDIEEGKILNKEKLFLIKSVLKERKLKVKILSSNQEEEEFFIKELYNKIPLTNIEFVTPSMQDIRRLQHISLAENKKYFINVVRFTSDLFVAKTVINKTLIFKIAYKSKVAQAQLKDYLNPSSKNKKYQPKIIGEVSKTITDYNYVAVKRGKVTGIYKQEEDWNGQTAGFKLASIKGFDNIENARVWMKRK